MAGDIAETAIFAYHSVLRMRSIIAIKETAMEFLSGQLGILEKEVELGLALAVDLAEAELALAEARIEIISLESDLTELELQFAELLGLEELPPLSEKIDVNREVILPSAGASVSLAEEKNPELVEARFSITKRQAELKVVSRSWIPTFKLTGSFGLTGKEYPLTRHTWSVGLNIDFSTPWLQNTSAFQYGREAPRDQTAALQNNFSPLPNPAASLGKRQAELALDYEREKYSLAFERAGRIVERTLEKCRLADRKRRLAVEAADIALKRYNLEELRLGLGHITRLELMKAHIDCTEKEISAVETALGQMQAERELEKFLDLRPGELATFAGTSLNFSTGD
jgi:outer membrane protein TolC